MLIPQAIVQAASGARSFAIVSYTVSAGTEGGGSSTGGWNTLPMNTEDYDPDGLVTISSNQLTLLAGTYECDADSVVYCSSFAKTRLRNVTDGTTLLVSMPQEINNVNNRSSTFRMMGVFTIASSQALEYQYQVSVAEAVDGLGRACGFAEVEVYRRMKFTKLA